MLTVDSEMNGDSKSSNERDPSLVGSLGKSCRYKRPYSALSPFICPHRITTWAGGRTGPPVSECVSPEQTILQLNIFIRKFYVGPCIRSCTCTIVLNSMLHFYRTFTEKTDVNVSTLKIFFYIIPVFFLPNLSEMGNPLC